MSELLKLANCADENIKMLIFGYIKTKSHEFKCSIPKLINYIVLYYYFNWRLEITVYNPYGEYLFFKLKMNTKLHKLMNRYCSHIGKPRNHFKFVFEGESVDDNDTPYKLGIKQNDTIEALITFLPSG